MTLNAASETTVLIPAAGRVPEGLLALSNIQNPALIPVAGRPVIHWTMSYLRSLGLSRFVIAVARRGGFIEDFVNCAFGATCDVAFITPSKAGGLGQTVADLAKAVATKRALVVLGDTHFQFADPALLSSDSPTVLVSPVEESYRWCVAETDASRTVKALRDKEADLAGPLEALIGVYGFPDAKLLARSADAAVAEAETAGRPTEMKAILDRVAQASPLKAERAGDWLDCGNADRQAASHQALLQKRAFNELKIDPVLGTITKRSRNVEKFIDEINYLRLLPAELAVLFPRVVDYSVAWESPHLTLEYYGYPSLSEAYVFENVDPGVWERIFGHLRAIVADKFMAHTRPLPQGALEDMLIGKTRDRVSKLSGELGALVTRTEPVRLNGREVASLAALWPKLEVEVARMAKGARGSIIHGDLCFSNILYDLRSRVCKLVDPRGSFGRAGVTGDARYDVAKLFHSVHGQYDFLVNDLFSVRHEGAALDLELRTRPAHAQIRERFERVFFAPGGPFERRDVLLITALLFASMLPLHDDAPRRQLAMYATALKLLDEVFA
ncbi:MAG: hypothetical protein JNK82_37900 [Myxococcaceae bacterium]|nr:hypothetical protein [Myxococcaceae bacterium]